MLECVSIITGINQTNSGIETDIIEEITGEKYFGINQTNSGIETLFGH